MGLLHDVGKIGIDDQVLKKSEPLTPEEYRVNQSHVEIGVHILEDLKKLHYLLPGVAHHHEHYNGTGYPGGLAGELIPLAAQTLAVGDGFDAMSSTPPLSPTPHPQGHRRDPPQGFRGPAGHQGDRRPVRLPGRRRVDPPERAGREPPEGRQRYRRPVVKTELVGTTRSQFGDFGPASRESNRPRRAIFLDTDAPYSQ